MKPDSRPDPAWLRRRLLPWYRRHRRPMPWRETRDPYPIWVSEVMLQQTQVATATPYYRRFLERFPTLGHLARARLDVVLREWSGLGYYRRARHLHEAARVVAREHGGAVPSDPAAFARLPGVGRYTTGAVLSIAFDRRLPVVDGNVARVLSRVFARPWSVRHPAGARQLWSLAGSLVPMRNAGDWNQALMELGATLCTPVNPRCGECPVRAGCRARLLARTAAFPPRVERRPTEHVRRALARIEHRGRVLMVRREGALLAGLWEPPGVELDGAGSPRRITAELAALGIAATVTGSNHTLRHTITHRRIEVEVWRAELQGAPPRSSRVRWVDPSSPSVALTALAARVAALDGAPPVVRKRRT